MIARDSQTVIVVTCDLTSDKSNGIERSVMKTWDTNENGYLLARRNNSVRIGELRVLKCNKNTTFFN